MKIEIDKPVVPKWFDEWYKNVPTEQDGYEATKEEHAIQLISQVGWGNGLYNSMSNLKRENDEAKVGYVLDNKMKLFYAILFGYDIEQEPLYYAKIKGWEILVGGVKWVYLENSKKLIIGDVMFSDNETEAMTKEEWNKLGINGKNADFEKVEQ